ncbi:MAG: non-canonical purine NTP pyrophosphatase [Verrucomicrobiaceae bacterium]|nr:non-canonical purine NTP pyrophosphatase [Verrucomicrobiaceae bacterium]
MPDLFFATSNAHKTAEVRSMLPGFSITDLRAHPGLTLPEETGETFEANAAIKACGASVALPPGTLVLADDSGLEVDALGGAPGARSARYSGENATDASNREKLKSELGALGAAPPFTGRFRCCMALVRDGKVLHVAHGTVEGTLRLAEQGEGGFGYDALFTPEGFSDTFGVLPAETKNQLSHRARALAVMSDWMQKNL